MTATPETPTPGCDTHAGLGEVLRENAKLALIAWHNDPTPATMTAWVDACEPLSNEEITQSREDALAELT